MLTLNPHIFLQLFCTFWQTRGTQNLINNMLKIVEKYYIYCSLRPWLQLNGSHSYKLTFKMAFNITAANSRIVEPIIEFKIETFI